MYGASAAWIEAERRLFRRLGQLNLPDAHLSRSKRRRPQARPLYAPRGDLLGDISAIQPKSLHADRQRAGVDEIEPRHSAAIQRSRLLYTSIQAGRLPVKTLHAEHALRRRTQANVQRCARRELLRGEVQLRRRKSGRRGAQNQQIRFLQGKAKDKAPLRVADQFALLGGLALAPDLILNLAALDRRGSALRQIIDHSLQRSDQRRRRC